MVNYWCEDLHLRCFQESWKPHYNLSLLLVILIICGFWLLQNLEKRKKSNKFNRLWIEVLFLPNISPPPQNIGPSNVFVCRYAQGVLTALVYALIGERNIITSTLVLIMRFLIKCLVLKHILDLFVYWTEQIYQ